MAGLRHVRRSKRRGYRGWLTEAFLRLIARGRLRWRRRVCRFCGVGCRGVLFCCLGVLFCFRGVLFCC
jgi:hypothetical protein